MKVIFLDIDGVLNSMRNVAAYGGYPFPGHTDDKHGEHLLDPLAIGMVRKLCKETGAVIVMHSMWRIHVDAVEFGKKHDLPIIGATSGDVGKPNSIKLWLSVHPDVKNYVVLDDDDMDANGRQIKTDMYEGLTYRDYVKALRKLSVVAGYEPPDVRIKEPT